MATGAGVFAVFTLVSANFVIRSTPQLLGLFAVVFTFSAVLLHVIIPYFYQRRALRSFRAENLEPDEQFLKLGAVFHTSHIIACVLLEGAGFMNIMAYSMGQWVLNLVLAIVLILLVLVRYPTKKFFATWVGKLRTALVG